VLDIASLATSGNLAAATAAYDVQRHHIPLFICVVFAGGSGTKGGGKKSLKKL
jgi:hypothetical protein